MNEAYDGLGATFDFYWDVFARNSIDGNGLPLLATVHYDRDYDNAFWDGERMIFGDGDGQYFRRFTIAVDVIGHELTYGVTGSGAAMPVRPTADQADWLISAGLFTSRVSGVALRSMKAPGTAFDDPVLGVDPQPAAMSGYVETTDDAGGVHTNSGIPNHAFYLAATGFGGFAWEQAGPVWYAALTDPALPPAATFAQFAALTTTKAGALFGERAAQIVTSAWRQVGVTS